MMHHPLVSIVIPVYNGGNYLRDAIDSALNQTYANCEVIVVNDGSTDDGATERIALSYGDKIRYFGKENGGVSTALNLGIRVMKGEYFSWLSHDDVYLPEKIQEQVVFLSGRHDAIVYSDFDAIDMQGKRLWTKIEEDILPKRFRYYLLFSHPINGCTTLIPREIFHSVGMFNDDLKTVQDYDMWYRIAKRFDYLHLPLVVSKIRFHSQQGTVLVKDECLREWSVFYRKAFDETLQEFDQAVFQSRICFCIKASVFFERIQCRQLSRYAGSKAKKFFKESGFDSCWSDIFWCLFLCLFRLKRFMFHRGNR